MTTEPRYQGVTFIRNETPPKNPFDPSMYTEYARSRTAGGATTGNFGVGSGVPQPGSRQGQQPAARQLPAIIGDFQDYYGDMPDPNAGFRDELARLERQRLDDIDNRLAALDSIYQQDRENIMKMFNTSEDPNAARMRDWALQELDNQASAAAQAITASFTEAQQRQQISANEARAIGSQIAARNAALYEQAAGNVAATNASLSAANAGALGAAPVSGEAIDTLGLLAAAAPREAALASTLGDIAAQRELAFQQSLIGQQASRQGELQRDTMATRSSIIMDAAQREADRQNREREAMRQAELALLGDYRNQQSSLMDQRSSALSEFGLAGAEAGRDSDMLAYEREQAIRDAALSWELDQRANTGAAGPIALTPDLQALYDNARNKEKAGVAISAIAIARSLPNQADQAVQLMESWNVNKDAFKAIGINDLTQLFAAAGVASWAQPSAPATTAPSSGRPSTGGSSGNRPGQNGAGRDGRTTGGSSRPSTDTGRPGSGGRARDGRTSG